MPINPDFKGTKSARRADRLNPTGFNLDRRGNPKQICNAKFGIKENITNTLNKLIEFFIYVAIIGITFSNAATEVGIGLSIFFFVIKTIMLKDFEYGRLKKIYILILIYFCFNLFSTFYSVYLYDKLYLGNNIKGLGRIIKYVFFLAAIVNTASSKKSLKRFINVFIFASIVICLDALFQYFTGVDLFRHRTMIPNDSLKRLSAAFVHPNDFGAYLITIIPLYIGLIYFHKKRYVKILKLIPLCLLLFCLYKTGSRGAWLGFLIAAMIFAIFKKDKILILTTIAFFIITPFFLPKVTFDRLKKSLDTSDGTSWERKQIWKGAISIIKVHPIVGFGPNTFSDNFPKYKPKEYPDLRYAHNSYLQMAAEIGILGLLIFLAMLFIILKNAFNAFRLTFSNQNNESNIILGLLCGLIAFLIHSFTDSCLQSLVLVTLFWIITGLIFAFNNIYVKNKS